MNWRRCSQDQQFYEGDRIVVAVPVRHAPDGRLSTAVRKFWDISIVSVSCDDEGPLRFEDQDGNAWGWDWSDAEWWFPFSELTASLPKID